jgi:hypothetical protein
MPMLTLIVYASLWKHIKKQELFMMIYLAFSIVLFGITNLLSVKHINNMLFYHISSLIELWLVSYYILRKTTGRNFPASFWVINTIYSCFFIYNILFLEPLGVFNSNSAGFSSLIILFLSMYYLLTLSKSDEILHFQVLPSFWIISGFLIYNAVSVLVLLSYKYFTYIHLPEDGNNLWFVLSAATIVKFALISTGLLCYRKQRTSHLPFLL